MDNSSININAIFFELLCVAIGTRKTLSINPSAEQWTELFALSKKQALVAVAFTGVTKLNPGSDFGASLGMDEMTYLKWLGLTAKVAQRNKELNGECVEVSRKLKESGFEVAILKGQSNQLYYIPGSTECRTPGDVDVWARAVDCSLSAHKKKVLGLVKSTVPDDERKGMEVHYHHVDYPISEKCQVELHFTPSYFNNPFTNHRFQEFVSLNGDVLIEECRLGYGVLTSWFNVVYSMQHIYRHLLGEGIGLRQLLDLYMLLRYYHNESGEFGDRSQSMGMWAEGLGRTVRSKEEIMHLLKRFGMGRFASAVMWVLKEVFAMPSVYCLCEPDEREGRFLLDEILAGGNFGKDNAEAMMAQKSCSALDRFWLREKFYFRLLRHYPSEIIWTPYWQIRLWLHIRKYNKYLH